MKQRIYHKATEVKMEVILGRKFLKRRK